MSYSGGTSSGESRVQGRTGLAKKMFRGLGNDLMNQAGPGGSGLGTPMGVLGPIYQNLFGGGQGDFMGAKGALQDTMSGQGFGNYVGQIQNQLMPSTMQNIQQGSNALQAAAGPAGLRFSTDLMGQQNQMAQGLMSQMQQNSIGAALPLYQQRGQQAQDIFGMIGQLGQQNNPMAALMALMGGGQTVLSTGGASGASGAYNGPYSFGGTGKD